MGGSEHEKAQKSANGAMVFLHDESGAITVDWTVLSAAVLGMGLTSVAAVRTGVVSLGEDVNSSLSNAEVAALGELGHAESGFAYSPIIISIDDIPGYVDDADGYHSDANLLLYYQHFAEAVDRFLSEGDAYNAAYYLDQMYIASLVMEGRGLEPSEDIATIEELYARYRDLE